MCAKSNDLFYIITKLEDGLSSNLFNAVHVGGFKFFMDSKGHKVSDYICYASNRQCALPTSAIVEQTLFEILPWLKGFIKVNVAPHGFTLSLSRISCFREGLKDVEKLGMLYGVHSLFQNEVFLCSVNEFNKHSDSLSALRLNTVKNALENLIVASGGYLERRITEEIKVQEVKITCNNNRSDLNNIYVGPIKTDSSHLTLDTYKSLRHDDITAQCEHKLDNVDECDQKNLILNASIIFDLLQHNIQKPVVLHLNEKDMDKRTSCKGAVFVLYNYARLYTLCERFESEVKEGVYPPLPELEEIDFSTLSLDEEWLIMFESILCWPSVLKRSIIDVKSGRPKIHLVLDFLKKIAANFSHFYRKTRVLTEPRTHLMPVLFARIYLLKCLLKVYHNAFRIVNIIPLQNM